MADDVWSTMPFDQAVQVNPTVRLERGSVYPFVDMQAVDPGSRSVGPSELREFKGGGSRFMNGDTLMARITPCLENGKIVRYAASKAEEVGHGSTEFIVIRGRPNVTDNGFAFYLTKWDGVRQYCISQMTGSSGRQRVPTSALSHCEVTIPPLPEQRAIACILGALDDKIELNRRMNRTLEATARAIFKSWFVDFLPVRAKMAAKQQDASLLLPQAEPGTWFVYALECDDGSVYIGQTEDLRQRWLQHTAGKGGRWTKAHSPQRVAYWERQPSREAAVERERWLKTGFGRKWLKKEIAAIARTQTGDPVRAKAAVRHEHPQWTNEQVSRAACPNLKPEIAALFPDAFEDSELGEIPKGWKVGTMGDLVKHVVDRIHPSPFTDAHPYVPIECIDAHSVCLVNSQPGRNARSSLVRFSKGDILFGAMRPYFHKVCIAPFDGTTRTTAFVLRPVASEKAFTAFVISRDETIDYATAHSEGSTIPYAKWAGSLQDMAVILPSETVRQTFHESVWPLIERMMANVSTITMLAALRDALLPKLISGELRVKDAERIAGRCL